MPESGMLRLDKEGAEPIIALRDKLRDLYTALNDDIEWREASNSKDTKKQALLKRMDFLEWLGDVMIQEQESVTVHVIQARERLGAIDDIGFLQRTLQEPMKGPLDTLFAKNAEKLGLPPLLAKALKVVNGVEIKDKPSAPKSEDAPKSTSLFDKLPGEEVKRRGSNISSPPPPAAGVQPMGGRYRQHVNNTGFKADEHGSLIPVGKKGPEGEGRG